MKRKTIFMMLAVIMVASFISMILPELQQLCSDFDTDTLMLATASVPAWNPLKWKTGQNNMGGYKPRLLFVPVGAVASMPVVGFDSTKNAYVASGAFTFNTGDDALTKPIYLYSTDGKVGYTAEPQGETDGISYKPTLTFFFPGNLPVMHLFNAMVKNTPGYYIYEDVDGQQFLLGEDGLPAMTSPSFNGGQTRSDARGTTYTATADSNYTAVLLGTPIDMLVVGGYKPEPTDP